MGREIRSTKEIKKERESQLSAARKAHAKRQSSSSSSKSKSSGSSSRSSSRSSKSSSRSGGVTRSREGGGTITVTPSGKVTERDAQGNLVKRYKTEQKQASKFIKEEGSKIRSASKSRKSAQQKALEREQYKAGYGSVRDQDLKYSDYANPKETRNRKVTNQKLHNQYMYERGAQTVPVSSLPKYQQEGIRTEQLRKSDAQLSPIRRKIAQEVRGAKYAYSQKKKKSTPTGPAPTRGMISPVTKRQKTRSYFRTLSSAFTGGFGFKPEAAQRARYGTGNKGRDALSSIGFAAGTITGLATIGRVGVGKATGSLAAKASLKSRRFYDALQATTKVTRNKAFRTAAFSGYGVLKGFKGYRAYEKEGTKGLARVGFTGLRDISMVSGFSKGFKGTFSKAPKVSDVRSRAIVNKKSFSQSGQTAKGDYVAFQKEPVGRRSNIVRGTFKTLTPDKATTFQSSTGSAVRVKPGESVGVFKGKVANVQKRTFRKPKITYRDVYSVSKTGKSTNINTKQFYKTEGLGYSQSQPSYYRTASIQSQPKTTRSGNKVFQSSQFRSVTGQRTPSGKFASVEKGTIRELGAKKSFGVRTDYKAGSSTSSPKLSTQTQKIDVYSQTQAPKLDFKSMTTQTQTAKAVPVTKPKLNQTIKETDNSVVQVPKNQPSLKKPDGKVGQKSKVIGKPIVLPASKRLRKEKKSFINPSFASSVASSQVSSQRSATSQSYMQKSTTRQVGLQKQTQKVVQKSLPALSTTQVGISPSVSKGAFSFAPGPTFGFKLPNFNKGGSNNSFFKPPKRSASKKSYRPTLYSSSFGIKGKQSKKRKKAGALTGLGIRPL